MAETVSISEAISDAIHEGKRGGMFMAAKNAVELLGIELSGGSAHALVEGLKGLASGAEASLGAIAAIGGISAVSVALNEMDYRHHRDKIRDTYKDELAVRLHKSPAEVTDKDLENLGKENRTVGEALAQEKKQRNFSLFMSVAASLAAFTLVTLIIPHSAAFSIGSMIARGVAGLITYKAIKEPIHWVGDKLFDLHKKTTHREIIGLKREVEQGKHISQEQVFSLFVHANPELADFIGHETGKPFDTLPVAAKEAVMARVGQLINLEALTDDINAGKVNVSELAFAVNGQISGLHREGPAEKPKEQMLEKIVKKGMDVVKGLAERKVSAHTPVVVPPVETETSPKAVPAPRAPTVLVDAAHEAPSGNFVKRLGRDKIDPNLTAVERLMQQNSNPQLAGGRLTS